MNISPEAERLANLIADEINRGGGHLYEHSFEAIERIIQQFLVERSFTFWLGAEAA